MSTNIKSYEQGYKDGITAYTSLCSRHPDCVDCPVVDELGENMTCDEFVQTHPERVASICMQHLNGSHSYFAEYRLRFPHSDLSLEMIVQSCCRKAVFEGSTDCTGGDCLSCWNAPYYKDVED